MNIKRILIIAAAVGLILVLSACAAPGSPASGATNNAPVVASENTPVVVSTTPVGNTVSNNTTYTAGDTGTPDCKNHGTVAWQNDNQLDGQAYGVAPVGGLDEVCWIVGQTWWNDPDGNPVRAVFAVRPHMVAWLAGHLGGTGWYFKGGLADVKANLAEQANQLKERDGEMKTLTIILAGNATEFPILDHYQIKP